MECCRTATEKVELEKKHSVGISSFVDGFEHGSCDERDHVILGGV